MKDNSIYATKSRHGNKFKINKLSRGSRQKITVKKLINPTFFGFVEKVETIKKDSLFHSTFLINFILPINKVCRSQRMWNVPNHFLEWMCVVFFVSYENDL